MDITDMQGIDMPNGLPKGFKRWNVHIQFQKKIILISFKYNK